jgi:hypothetical protein
MGDGVRGGLHWDRLAAAVESRVKLTLEPCIADNGRHLLSLWDRELVDVKFDFELRRWT